MGFPQSWHLVLLAGFGSSRFSLSLIACVVSELGLVFNAFCRSCFAIARLSLPNIPSKMFDGLTTASMFLGRTLTKFCGYFFDLSRSITANRCLVLVMVW